MAIYGSEEEAQRQLVSVLDYASSGSDIKRFGKVVFDE
jgi:hypothetical protein